MQKNSRTVFVGLSGGVDSAVSAYLLKKEGYSVVGVFIKTWSPEWLPCPWREERRDAIRVAAHLDIPFLTFDLTKEYKEYVADYFIEEYRQGRTPNPDVLCNKEIKFGAFLSETIRKGADMIATGHYARNIDNHLHTGIDTKKDQSYFLWMISKEQLSRAIFPVGDLTKEEVRKIAAKIQLPVSEKKDSQGICFLGDVDMKEFLKHYIQTSPGEVLDEASKVIGSHEGAVLYTIGERHGFTVFAQSNEPTPLYIVGKDLTRNTLTVSEKRPEEFSNTKEVKIEKVNWINEVTPGQYLARVRYRQPLQKITLNKSGEQWGISFEEPQIIAPGQSIVLYNKEECLGGGIIS